MLAASMDITKTTSSSPEAGQGDLHLATHSAVFYFSFQIAFKEEIKLKIQENAYSSWLKRKIKVSFTWRNEFRLFIK